MATTWTNKTNVRPAKLNARPVLRPQSALPVGKALDWLEVHVYKLVSSPARHAQPLTPAPAQLAMEAMSKVEVYARLALTATMMPAASSARGSSTFLQEHATLAILTTASTAKMKVPQYSAPDAQLASL